MSLYESFGLKVLRQFDPERAHILALAALSFGLAPTPGVVRSKRLATRIGTLDFANPIGLAAGFDKNAQSVTPLSKTGFGFLEVGATTPRPQPGNPKPRLFRLTEDEGVINRFGFNNDGMDAMARRLNISPSAVPVGLNLGANKDSDDRASDYSKVLMTVGGHVDFATVNVSSPNTEKLRDLQGRDALAMLLGQVMETNDTIAKPLPIFLKIAPDLNTNELADVAEVAQAAGLTGIIATNTTLARDGLASAHKGQAGGLSGQPLFEKSTRVLAQLSTMTDLPLIGVGGIGSAQQAYAKIKAGASAVQLYSAMVYSGVSLAGKIAKELDTLLEADGYSNVAEAVGTDRGAWL
jgi:dihydroorotate dehydrogenase